MLGSDGNTAACVGCPQAGNCLLPTAWQPSVLPPALCVTKSPVLGCVTKPTVKGSAVGSTGSQCLCSFPSLCSKLPNPPHSGWKRAFLESSDPDVLLTTSSCGFQCRQLHLTLASCQLKHPGAGLCPKPPPLACCRPRDSGSRAGQGPAGSGELLLQSRDIRMLLCAQAAWEEAASSPGEPPHTHSCRPWLVSDAIREMSSPSTASTHCVVSLWL